MTLYTKFFGVVYETQWQISEDSNIKLYDNNVKETSAIEKPDTTSHTKLL